MSDQQLTFLLYRAHQSCANLRACSDDACLHPSSLPVSFSAGSAEAKRSLRAGASRAFVFLPPAIIHPQRGSMYGEIYRVEAKVGNHRDVVGEDQEKMKTIKRRESVEFFLFLLLSAVQFAKDMGRVRQTEGFTLQNFPELFIFSKKVLP